MQRIVPWLGKRIFRKAIWNYSRLKRELYLTFDDGPHPTITPWVLNELKKYKAKATFFCIGKNVEKFPEIFQQIIAEGHSVGNHSYSHLKGWTVSTQVYLKDVAMAAPLINSKLFRAPYGKPKPKQTKALNKLGYKTIFWDVLTQDYDSKLLPEKIWNNILKRTRNGSIIVFHDSEKAFAHLQVALPKLLTEYNEQGFKFVGIAD